MDRGNSQINERYQALAAAAPLLTNHWRTVLKKLGMTQTEMQEVVNQHRHKRPDEVVYQALLKWQEMFMGDATLDELIDVLVEMNLDEVVETVRMFQKPVKPVSPPKLKTPPPEPKPRGRPNRIQKGDAEKFMALVDRNTGPYDSSPLQTWRPEIPDIQSPKVVPPRRQTIEIPTEKIRGDFGYIVPRIKSVETSSVRPPPSTAAPTDFQIPPMLSYSEIATPFSLRTLHLEDAPPPEEESPMKIFEYNYVASLVSPIQKFKREPRYGGICFLQENDIVLLDKANSQVEIHECQRIFDGKRFAFKGVFKVPQSRTSKLGGIAVYQNVIIVLDTGGRCLRFFTAKGQPAGMVKFRHQPMCIALRDSRAAIAFWNTNINKGSIVTYRANIATNKTGVKTFSLFLPNAVAGVTNKYCDITITDNQEIIAMTEDGRLFLFGFRSQLSSTYVCHAIADSTDLRCVRCSKDGVLVCNNYRDTLIQIPLIGEEATRAFDTKNSRPILNEEDGINGVKGLAVFEEDNDIAIINNFGSRVHMYGNRKIQYKESKG